MLNQGRYDLPEPPKLADFDQSLQDYEAQVQAEIAPEAAAAGMTVEEYAAAGFEAPQQDSFSIYQLRNEDSTRDYRFEPYDRLQAAGNVVDRANYELVYSAPLAPETSLEDIYTCFNIDHPKDFKGHSLSVSDVVVLHQNGTAGEKTASTRWSNTGRAAAPERPDAMHTMHSDSLPFIRPEILRSI